MNNKAETTNQIKLLRALSVRGAVLIGTGWSTPHRVQIPGVPTPTLETQKQTVKACVKRGWIIGSNEDGYRITGFGILALGCA